MRRALSLGLALAACNDGTAAPPRDTSGVDVSGISVTATVTSNGAAMLIDASVAGGGAVRLAPDDLLLAGAPDAPERALGEYPASKATFGYALLLPSAEARLTLGFSRRGQIARQDFALPDAFVVVAPKTASRSAPITLAWTPGKAGESFTLEVRGPCVAQGFRRTADPIGTSFDLQPADFPNTTGSCTLEVKAARTVTVKGGFAGLAPGVVTLVQLRTVTIETQP